MANRLLFSPLLILAPLLSIFLILTPPVVSFAFQPLNSGIRIGLKHIDSDKNLSKLQLVKQSLARSKQRSDRLTEFTKTTSKIDIQATVQPGNGEYLMNISIGTPPLPFVAIMDTGSDLIWSQCKPCKSCFEQPTPVFDPAKSSSFSNVSCSCEFCKSLKTSRCKSDGCEYLYTYGDDSSTEGYLAFDTLSFGDDQQKSWVSVRNVAFGCGVNNQGKGLSQGAGIIGLGRGPLSLVSQLGIKKFSYCLTSIGQNKTSSLLFGSASGLNISTMNGSPLVRNSLRPTFYYLSLEGITVGETLLPIPKSVFELGDDGNGGMIIDSGTTISYIQQEAFDVVKQAFVTQTKLKVSDSETTGLDLCFDAPRGQKAEAAKVPKLVFHFKGLDLELPRDNYMITDERSGLICLAMGGAGTVSILGNFQQQNMLVLHHLDKETVSFVPTECDAIM